MKYYTLEDYDGSHQYGIYDPKVGLYFDFCDQEQIDEGTYDLDYYVVHNLKVSH